jgi:anti-sigma B factor antagonist
MGLQIAVRQAGEVTILDMQGRVTIGTGNDTLSSTIKQTLDGGARKVVLNLRGVNQIDSSGISTVVRAFVTLGRSGGGLKLLGATGRVRDVLEVTRLLASIPHFEAEADAVKSFK